MNGERLTATEEKGEKQYECKEETDLHETADGAIGRCRELDLNGRGVRTANCDRYFAADETMQRTNTRLEAQQQRHQDQRGQGVNRTRRSRWHKLVSSPEV